MSPAACTCDPRGTLDQLCGVGGTCHCRPGYAGAACQECSPGFHGFPDCARECPCRGRGGQACPHRVPTPCLPRLACHCSTEGSLHASCDPRSGQCSCRPRVTGPRCDMCVPGAYNFPSCEGEPRAVFTSRAACVVHGLSPRMHVPRVLICALRP